MLVAIFLEGIDGCITYEIINRYFELETIHQLSPSQN